MIAYSRTVESFVYPLLVFSQSVPKIAIAPLFVVWFGFGIIPKVIAAFLLGFFPVVVSTVMGFKSVEPDMLDLARSMGASRLQIFLKISLPQALPSIFSGPEGLGHAGGRRRGGRRVRRLQLGHRLRAADRQRQLRPAADVRRAGRCCRAIGVLLFVAVDVVERLMIPWHASQRHDVVATA